MAVAAWAAGTAFLSATSDAPQQDSRLACSSVVLLLERQQVQAPLANMVGDTVTDGTCVWTAIA